LRPDAPRETSARLQAGRLVPLEMRIEPAEKQALQPICLREDCARHAFPLQAKNLRQAVHRVGNVSTHELILTYHLDIASGGIRERKEVF